LANQKKRFSAADRASYIESKKTEVKGLLDKLSDNVKALTSSDDWKKYLNFQTFFRRYSFNNVLLIAAQCPNATAVAGYRAWQKVGRQVKKGEKSIKILAPIVRKFTVEKDNDQGGTDEVEKKSLYFRAVPVFDVSQTEGEPLPTAQRCTLLSGSEDAAAEVFDALQSFAANLGYTVEDESLAEGLNGFVDFQGKRIVLRASNPKLQKAKTLAHEIAHALLHSTPEARKDIAHDSSDYREVEAESVAFCVMNAHRLDSGSYSFGYVATWSGGDTKKIQQSATRIQKAVCQILDAVLPETEMDESDEDGASEAA
jgi:antirestriction protein ArdC